MKKTIQIKNAPSPVGSYSQAILVDNTLYISGQIAIDPFSGELNLGTIESQTKLVMDNIVALLDAANLTTLNLVKCSIFLTNMNDFTAVDKIYASYFKENFPARETVQVSALPKGVNVEISAIATLNI
jgi:2-iminobutanoate/2-iminopropanoate deaminase